MRKFFLFLFLLFVASPLLAQTTQSRLPTGDVNATWTPYPSTPTTRYDKVDDEIGNPDEDSTYIYYIGGVNNQQHSFTAFNIDSSSITDVTVWTRCKEVNGQVTVKAILKVNGTVYPIDSAQPLSGTYDNYSHVWALNPDTSLAWTEADVEGTGSNPLQAFGPMSYGCTGTEEIWCTQVYAVVTYTEAAGGGTRHLLQLMGVGK